MPSAEAPDDDQSESVFDNSQLASTPLEAGKFMMYSENAEENLPTYAGVAPLRPRATIEWDGPVRDFEDSERFAAAHMRYLGFADAIQTQAGTDSGIDVESIRAVAQVKFHAQPIGSTGLQNLRGVAWQKEYALFYSLSGYTRRALEWGDANHIVLFSYTKDGTVRPENAAARTLERQSRAMLQSSPSPAPHSCEGTRP
ncbi:restriction endonuclease (plasmid) [Prescottella equi]|uniref:restriction endonuclease n=1 Tax=Rhodococcus hoagii TaxID=43767 RepID=UPI0025755B60|nr:restriction endonuclease [Prescottella equi]WJJ14509.1 restriction endonuclease [Prescottella equi]